MLTVLRCPGMSREFGKLTGMSVKNFKGRVLAENKAETLRRHEHALSAVIFNLAVNCSVSKADNIIMMMRQLVANGSWNRAEAVS